MVAASRQPTRWFAVAAGGALGTLARYEVTLAIPTEPAHFPWAIALVNLVGCLFVGITMAVLRARPLVPDAVRLFLVVGICGGLTTFSTWMVTDVLLANEGHAGLAVLDLTGSLVLGLAAVWAGYRATAAVVDAPGGDLDVREAD